MNILGVNYDNLTVKEALARVISLIEGRQKASIFFLNADCYYKMQKDKEYRSCLQHADLLLPDGIGLSLATKILGGSMKENCNGTDFSPLILEEAVKRNWSVFFMGSKVGIAERASIKIRSKFPALRVVGTNSGYFDDDDDIIRMINEAEPDILFVAMGVPLQEKWIINNRSYIDAGLCIGVGAFFDYLSGAIPRAPIWMQKTGLEWFWRLCMEPGRLWKRYLIDVIEFFVLVLKQKIRGEK